MARKAREEREDFMRQPVNIHVYLYRQEHNGTPWFAVFQRADDPRCWQGISGGAEEGETARQAALREAFEEAGVATDSPIYPLDTVSSLPSDIFSVHPKWGKDVLVCPNYFFAIPFYGSITLSAEHLDARWCTYPKAYERIYWHDQKTALWELNQRLVRGNLIR